MIGFIYIIELNNEIYVGSTNDLRTRTDCHNRRIKKCNYKLYKYCRANDIEQVDLIIIEEIEHDTLEELHIVEEQYRQSFNATLNGKKCHTTKDEQREKRNEYSKEWNQNNKEYNKEWYQNNKEYKNEYNKEWSKVKVTCDICYSFIRRGDLGRHKKTKKCTNYL